MSPKQLLDPLALRREAIDRLEGGLNSYATRNMESERFSQALAIVLRAGLGTHHLFDKNLARLYERLGLPSRSELEAVAATMRRIEDKLDMLLPPPAPAHRPARTKRAPAAAAALAAPVASPEAKTVSTPVRAKATASKQPPAVPARRSARGKA